MGREGGQGSLELLGYERARDSRGTIKNHVRGIKGEYAVARLLGVEIDTNTYEGGDGGRDLCYRGQRIDVKTVSCKYNTPALLVDANRGLHADCYVLAQELNRRTYRVCGYAHVDRVARARIMPISRPSPVFDAVQAGQVHVVEQDGLARWRASASCRSSRDGRRRRLTVACCTLVQKGRS